MSSAPNDYRRACPSGSMIPKEVAPIDSGHGALNERAPPRFYDDGFKSALRLVHPPFFCRSFHCIRRFEDSVRRKNHKKHSSIFNARAPSFEKVSIIILPMQLQRRQSCVGKKSV
uniref:C2H2-type domain-containing protein n=1 Tax=Trichuris muris TaxID=70415 RepID=A0A5S6QCA9_TRIMR